MKNNEVLITTFKALIHPILFANSKTIFFSLEELKTTNHVKKIQLSIKSETVFL